MQFVITPTRGICRHDPGGHQGDILSISHITTGGFIIDLFLVAMFSFGKPS